MAIKKQVAVMLPQDLHTEAKQAAKENSKTFSEWLTQVIEKELKRIKKRRTMYQDAEGTDAILRGQE